MGFLKHKLPQNYVLQVLTTGFSVECLDYGIQFLAYFEVAIFFEEFSQTATLLHQFQYCQTDRLLTTDITKANV
jgi:hypothetical protein